VHQAPRKRQYANVVGAMFNGRASPAGKENNVKRGKHPASASPESTSDGVKCQREVAKRGRSPWTTRNVLLSTSRFAVPRAERSPEPIALPRGETFAPDKYTGYVSMPHLLAKKLRSFRGAGSSIVERHERSGALHQRRRPKALRHGRISCDLGLWRGRALPLGFRSVQIGVLPGSPPPALEGSIQKTLYGRERSKVNAGEEPYESPRPGSSSACIVLFTFDPPPRHV
jgi:hypothetical protein